MSLAARRATAEGHRRSARQVQRVGGAGGEAQLPTRCAPHVPPTSGSSLGASALPCCIPGPCTRVRPHHYCHPAARDVSPPLPFCAHAGRWTLTHPEAVHAGWSPPATLVTAEGHEPRCLPALVPHHLPSQQQCSSASGPKDRAAPHCVEMHALSNSIRLSQPCEDFWPPLPHTRFGRPPPPPSILPACVPVHLCLPSPSFNSACLRSCMPLHPYPLFQFCLPLHCSVPVYLACLCTV